MAFTNNPYCLLQDVKTALDLQSTTDDQWIDALIIQAQAVIDDYIGYAFQQDVGTQRVYNGDGDYVLFIDDCLSFSQVLETTYNSFMGSSGLWVTGTTQTVDITADVVFMGPDVNVPPFTLLGRISGLPFTQARRNYVVTGTWGQPAIPTPIARACVRLVIHWYKMRDANYQPQTGQQQFGTPRFMAEIPSDVAELLKQYRRSRFYAR